MFSKKGITPVIATVLLLMMTVSAAAGAYYWITTVQSNLQETAQGAISSSGVSGQYRISVLSGGTSCTASTDTITIYMKNSGSNDIPAGDWYAFGKNTQGQSVGTWSNSTSPGTLSADATTSIDFSLDSGAGITAGNVYTIQINGPKSTSATTSCKAQ